MQRKVGAEWSHYPWSSYSKPGLTFSCSILGHHTLLAVSGLMWPRGTGWPAIIPSSSGDRPQTRKERLRDWRCRLQSAQGNRNFARQERVSPPLNSWLFAGLRHPLLQSLRLATQEHKTSSSERLLRSCILTSTHKRQGRTDFHWTHTSSPQTPTTHRHHAST